MVRRLPLPKPPAVTAVGAAPPAALNLKAVDIVGRDLMLPGSLWDSSDSNTYPAKVDRKGTGERVWLAGAFQEFNYPVKQVLGWLCPL